MQKRSGLISWWTGNRLVYEVMMSNGTQEVLSELEWVCSGHLRHAPPLTGLNMPGGHLSHWLLEASGVSPGGHWLGRVLWAGAYQPSGTAMQSLAPPVVVPKKLILLISTWADDLKAGSNSVNSLRTLISIELLPYGISPLSKYVNPSSFSFEGSRLYSSDEFVSFVSWLLLN